MVLQNMFRRSLILVFSRNCTEIRLTRPNDASGTLGFMPPEQVVNFSGLDVRADIYSLGASLYFILRELPY